MQTRFIRLGLAILMMAGACGGSDSTDTSASPLSTDPATFSPTDSSTAMTVTEDGDVSMVWDLGGFVFGTSDPDGETQG